MAFLGAFGDFSEMVLGLAFSAACALVLAFVCLRMLLAFMSRQPAGMSRKTAGVRDDHNVDNDPTHAGSLLLLDAAVAGSNGGVNGVGAGANGSPYLLPAAAPRNRFVGVSKPDGVPGGRVVELPVPVAGRAGSSWSQDGWSGDGGDAA